MPNLMCASPQIEHTERFASQNFVGPETIEWQFLNKVNGSALYCVVGSKICTNCEVINLKANQF